jgi:hypothetical protein
MKAKVTGFFKQEYIAVQNVTREVAEASRDLVWDFGIKPKDALHVASAIAANVGVFETFDAPLIRKGKKVASIEFRQPPARPQPTLALKGGGLNVRADQKEAPAAERQGAVEALPQKGP